MPSTSTFDPRDIPRSSTELFPNAFGLSPKQRLVLNALQSFAQGAKAAEVAEFLDMHVNTARGHLDELVAKGAARVEPAAAAGRGRPSLIYAVRVPKGEVIAQEYVSLISVLSAVTETNPAGLDPWVIGAQWARNNWNSFRAEGGSHDEFLAKLLRLARDMGFDPTNTVTAQATAAESITLNACPFVTDSIMPTPFICSLHAGFLAEAGKIGPRQPVELTLLPLVRQGQCNIHIDRQPEREN